MNTYLNRFEKKFFLDADQEKKLKKGLKNIFGLIKISK